MVERTEATSASWPIADPSVASGWRSCSMMWKFLRTEDTALNTDKEKGKSKVSAETCRLSPSRSRYGLACRPAGSARRSSHAAVPPPAPASGPGPPPGCPRRPRGCSGAHSPGCRSCWRFWRALWINQCFLVVVLVPKPGRVETWGDTREDLRGLIGIHIFIISRRTWRKVGSLPCADEHNVGSRWASFQSPGFFFVRLPASERALSTNRQTTDNKGPHSALCMESSGICKSAFIFWKRQRSLLIRKM